MEFPEIKAWQKAMMKMLEDKKVQIHYPRVNDLTTFRKIYHEIKQWKREEYEKKTKNRLEL